MQGTGMLGGIVSIYIVVTCRLLVLCLDEVSYRNQSKAPTRVFFLRAGLVNASERVEDRNNPLGRAH